MQPLSKDDSLWRILPGHPDGDEQGSHQGHLKVALVLDQLDDGAIHFDDQCSVFSFKLGTHLAEHERLIHL